MDLSQLEKNKDAVVMNVEETHAQDFVARRLKDLGFVAGEPIRVVAFGTWHREPILVQIGSTRFALRRKEAERVSVQIQGAL